MIVLVIGSRTMTVDGVGTNLDAPATIVEDRTLVALRALVENLGGSISWNAKVVPILTSGRTMLPLRFVAENLGLQVDWNANKRVVTLSWED